MAPAVTTVLTAVLGQSTAWDDFEDPWFAGLQSEMEARPLAGIGPHSRQNSWQPQATGATTSDQLTPLLPWVIYPSRIG